jgi:ABC-type antimicrobial peptide transport system permease subunit
MGLVAVGTILGLGAAALLTRAMQDLLFDVPRFDPLTYLGVVGVMGLVAGASCWVPARRAAGVDPATAVRGE